METFALDLITPESIFFSGPAHQVEAPGTLGDFGVLPGHMNFISTLRPGVVTIHNANDAQTRIFVAGGIAQVDNVSCTILAERVIDLASLSRADAEARLSAARIALDNAFEDDVKADAARELELAEAILQALAA